MTPAVTEAGRVRRPRRRKRPPNFWFLANAGGRNVPWVVPTSRDDRLTRVRAVRSIRAEPGIAANRQPFPSPYDLAFPQDLHDPQIRRGVASPSISCSRPHGIGFVLALFDHRELPTLRTRSARVSRPRRSADAFGAGLPTPPFSIDRRSPDHTPGRESMRVLLLEPGRAGRRLSYRSHYAQRSG